MKPAGKTHGWKAGGADLRLLQVRGFQRFTAGVPVDFEKHEVCAARFCIRRRLETAHGRADAHPCIHFC
jgi:hypothetical protein